MIESLFGRDLLACATRTRARHQRRALEYWRAAGFPYERLAAGEMSKQLAHVSRAPLLDLAKHRTIGASPVGLGLANSYHPQIWHARSHRHRLSPFDYFQDDNHLGRMLERAPRFWPNARCWSAQAVRNLARIYGGGRVANFRPCVARNIIHHFSRPTGRVLDFSAGYGGRLLGCLALERTYIGIDPAVKQMAGLRRMSEELGAYGAARVELIHGCAEDVLPEFPANSVDLVFSSPPFFNLEIYSDEATQSAHRYPKYQSWRSCFLEVVLTESRRVLRRKGLLAINVSSGPRHSLEADTLGLATKLFSHRCTLQVAMPARPLQRASDGTATRTEPIHVFQKR